MGVILYHKQSFPFHSEPELTTNKDLAAVFSFIKEWKNDDPYIHLKTSGTTGEAKSISVKKEQMLASAKSTLSFFDLKEGQTALLCLNPAYIASKMMIVRAKVGNLNLVVTSAKANPLRDLPKINIEFAAMVPIQVQQILDKGLKEVLEKIPTIIIGGAAISNSLNKQLSRLKNNIYETFGMTETLSHIAVRKVSQGSDQKSFTVLPGVEIGVDERDCLWITGKVTDYQVIQTNDIVEKVGSNQFIWKGRIDNMINTGGVKIFPEQIEPGIKRVLKHDFNLDNELFIFPIEDDLLGQKVCLVLESPEIDDDLKKGISKRLANELPAYSHPKEIFNLPNFTYTNSGKIKRKETLKHLKI